MPYHDLSTNANRSKQYDLLASLPFVTAQRKKQSLSEYYDMINDHKFVIGLEGSGPDIHRNYETMLMGSIPINIRNCIENLFNFHNISGVFLNNWRELNHDKFHEILLKKYDNHQNDKFLNLDYHIKLINTKLNKG